MKIHVANSLTLVRASLVEHPFQDAVIRWGQQKGSLKFLVDCVEISCNITIRLKRLVNICGAALRITKSSWIVPPKDFKKLGRVKSVVKRYCSAFSLGWVKGSGWED